MLNLSLILACLWFLVANVLALTPSRDDHWTFARCLIALGIPLLGYVTLQNGPWVGLLVLAAGMSVLRWPVYFAARWLRRRDVGK